jgi:glycerol-3-phosphate dehydrogenase
MWGPVWLYMMHLEDLSVLLPGHKHLSQKTISEIAPSLRTDVITGAIRYFDAQVDDARHTMMIARTAKRHGAVIVTRASVDSLIKK